MPKHKLEDIELADSFWEKLWRTILIVVFGGMIAVVYLNGPRLPNDPRNHPVLRIASETVAVYFLTLLVYIWWRPKFMQRFYASKERTFLFIAFTIWICWMTVFALEPRGVDAIEFIKKMK